MGRLPTYWQQWVDAWNRTHPSHPPLCIRWDPCAVRYRTRTTRYGATVLGWRYEPRWTVGVVLPAYAPGLRRVLTYLGVGQWFVKLFSWSQKDQQGRDIGFAPVDERVFRALRMMDTTKRNVLQAVEAEDAAKEEQVQAQSRDIAYGMKEKYRKWDSPTVAMNPQVRAGGDWRHRIR